jgi:TonB family protein
VSLEHFKTQVLLLHNKQSTLDVLSTGFNDRYAVHIATSGTEALHTLGVTPIHVIVSAQDLPGMSGLDAIREAKKRSPETIGILLAGTDHQDGLEALVGDKEVFQIVRGEITPDALVNLIESATKRMRLIAIAESANDQAANVDEPVSEHIVMETSVHGAAIISDGTGQMPALKPQKVQPAAEVGSRGVDVLVLTKDEEFLATIRDSSRGLHNVHHANIPTQAEEIVRNNKVGVLVTDAAMVGSNIEAITHKLRAVVPRMVAVVAGRRDDGELLMDLINRGHVYRFLLKPVSPGRARLAIEASVKHHLEADDSAFKQRKPPAAPARQDEPDKVSRRPAAKPVTTSAPKKPPAKRPVVKRPVVKRPVAKKPVSEAKKAPRAATARKKRVDPTISARALDLSQMESSPIDDRLDDAFSDGGGFTETMTGIAATVTKSFTSAKKSIAESARTSEPVIANSLDGEPDGSVAMAKAISIAAAIVVAAAGFWYFSGSDTDPASSSVPPLLDVQSQSTPTVSESDIAIDATPGPGALPAQPAYQELLYEARIARDAGELVGPIGSSAVELYVAAREAAPGDMEIVAELTVIIDQVVAMAESAILQQRLDDAAIALSMVALASPDNPRLGFLEAQLGQLQLRTAMDGARAAIREGRLEDASAKIAAFEQLAADSPDLRTLNEELASAKSAQEIDEVLSLAAQRLDDGRLVAPSNNNARYYYELALSNDPRNAAAAQGMILVAARLVLQARQEIGKGNLDNAAVLLRDARDLDPSSSDLAASTQALENARESGRVAAAQAETERRRAAEREAELKRQAEAERLADIDRVAEAERLAELERIAEQERQAAARQAAAVAAAAIATESSTAAGGSSVAAGSQGTSSPANIERNTSQQQIIAPETSAATMAVADNSRSNGTPQQSANSATPTGSANAEPEWIGVSTLTRVNYVAPKYPRAARRRNVTGSVDVSFVVTSNGEVRDIEVMESTPGSTFDDAAIEAVTGWRFEPVFENGIAVEKRSAVRLAFDLE